MHLRRGLVVLMAAAALLAGCQSTGTQGTSAKPPGSSYRYGHGDGQSMATAVELRTQSESQGQALMEDWIKARYPGFAIRRMDLVEHHGRAYNLVTLVGPAATRQVFFDISAYHRFGHDNLPKPIS
jgi:hypothetical protein